MAVYDLTLVSFDGQSLTVAPFSAVFFDPDNGPMQTGQRMPVEAEVIGRGDRDAGRAQPKGADWDVQVLLATTNETDRRDMLRIFSPDRGLAYLVANDGDGVAYRVQCRVRQVERLAAGHYLVRLRVPNPIMEANALTTDVQFVSMSGNSAAHTIAQAGNRRSRPTVLISADALKQSTLNDWSAAIYGHIANRSPYWLHNYPFQVFSNSDGGDSLDTAQIVKNTAISNLLNGAIAAGATTINIDTPAGGGLPTPAGMAYIGDGVQNGGAYEQIYYTGNSGTQLTGGVRGIGGTTAYGWNDNTPIYQSGMLANGDDLRVWVNGKQVERWLSGMNTSATRCWINLTLPPRQKFTLASPTLVQVTGENSVAAFQEDIAALPESGAIFMGSELWTYKRKNLAKRQVGGIQRAAWGTAQDGNWPCYLVSALIEIGRGYAKAAPPEASDARRPAIELNRSAPNRHYWGDESQDAKTVFYDPATPDRSMMWRPDFTVPAADENKAEALRLDVSTTKAAWKDSDPTGGKLQVGRLTIDLPVRIEAGVADAITLDVQTRKHQKLRVLGRDAQGFEAEANIYWTLAETLYSATSFPAYPGTHQLTLNAVRSHICGAQGTAAAGDFGLGGLNEHAESIFILDQETEITRLLLSLRKQGAGDAFTFRVDIRDNSGSTPNAGRRIARFDLLGPTDATGLTTASVIYEYQSASGTLRLQAGTYWISVHMSGFTSGILIIDGVKTDSKHNLSYQGTIYIDGQVFWFGLLHPKGGPIQPEAVLLNSGAEAYFDRLNVQLDDGADNQVPIVRRRPTDNGNYHCNAVISNDRNPFTLTIDAWIPLAGELQIDCEAQTVKWVNGIHELSLIGAITASDESEWFVLEPGNNIITYTEEGMQNTDMTVTYRPRRE